MTDPAAVAAEVVRLHDFFERWYAGDMDRSLDEFTRALDERFTIVTPQGNTMERDEIVKAVEAGRGGTPVLITVEAFEVTDVGGVAVCRYVETHEATTGRSRRISTAVMEPDDRAPGGFRWVTVHETWAAED